MDRRHVMFAGLAAAASSVVSSAAFAQSAQPMPAQPMPAQPMPAQPMPAQPMGDPEAKHAKDTMTVGSLSLATSRLAVQKAKHAKVKEFALFEVAEQETIADILKSMTMDPMQTSGAVNPPSDDEVMAALDDEGKAALSKLDGLSGRRFEAAYVTAQTEGHEKLLTIQETYLAVGKNREALGVTKLARGQIKEHLTLLADIHGMMKG